MGSPVVVEGATARYFLVEIMADWADPDFQQRHWISHEYAAHNASNPYDESYTLEDLCGVIPAAANALGHSLGTSTEVSRAQSFVDTYEPFEDSGVIDWNTYVDMVNHPTWTEIVTLCRQVLTVLVLNGGTIDPDLLDNRDEVVARTRDRHLVVQALASIAEATYRQPGEYTDEDAPAYLISPEQAIDTLLTTGHLDNSRSQIGVIYRDTYEETHRLEALHNKVVRYRAGEITLADLVDPAVDTLCSIIRNGAGWDLNPDELAAARARATTLK